MLRLNLEISEFIFVVERYLIKDKCISPYSYLYQIAHLGDDDDEPEFSSAMPLEEGDTFFFAPRPLRNLVLVDEMDSLSPIMACQVIMAYIFENYEIYCWPLTRKDAFSILLIILQTGQENDSQSPSACSCKSK